MVKVLTEKLLGGRGARLPGAGCRLLVPVILFPVVNPFSDGGQMDGWWAGGRKLR